MEKFALISLSDKEKIEKLAETLIEYGYTILSTGGTAKYLEDRGVKVKYLEDYTGFPEILSGRVKTLHPKLHGGILALRDDEEHKKSIKENKISYIDFVIVNLYPFEDTVKKGASLELAIENIDIGGVTLIRSSAKNYRYVTVVTSKEFYDEVIEDIKKNNGNTTLKLREKLAVYAFQLTSFYDSLISNYLGEKILGENLLSKKLLTLPLRFKQNLRYGENPHQKATFYSLATLDGGINSIKQLHGKELSFNNIYDTDAALLLVLEFNEPAVAIIKHTNPCGFAIGENIKTAFLKAYETDPLSAFGGVYALNKEVNLDVAEEISKNFVEVIAAPSFSEEAFSLLSKKKNIRLLEVDFKRLKEGIKITGKFVSGGILLQEGDGITYNEEECRIVTKRKPEKKELRDLNIAFKVVKHVKSNAICYVKDGGTVAIGAGQMSRVDAVKIANLKKSKIDGCVMASDAFFPFRDAIDSCAEAGIKAIIQPGGSIKDEEVIKAADEHGIAMIFTGIRHFRH